MSEKPYCKVCNKEFSSKSSLCNHNKRFHVPVIQKQSNSNLETIQQQSRNNPVTIQGQCKNTNSNMQQIYEPINYLKCLFCYKLFSHKNNRWKHEKICKAKEAKEKQRELVERKERIKLEKEELKIALLKKKLQTSDKVEPITLQKLNKMLLERQNRIKNSTVNSHNNIHNNIQNITNNYQIIGFGREENIPALLTNQEKHAILNSKYCSLQKLIDIIHCGKYDQFKNIIITNIKDNYMYKYDEGKGIFVLSEKSDILNSLINYRLDDLEIIYNEFVTQNKVDEKTKKCIEDFVNKMNYDENQQRQFQINEIKMLLFNNKDKITNDISLLLTVNEI